MRSSSSTRSPRLAFLVCLVLLLGVGSASAQRGVRPGDDRPDLEPFAPQTPVPPPLDLPPIPPPQVDRPDGISGGARVEVVAFRVEGSTVFSAADFAPLTEPYSGRAITTEELLRARDAISDLYVDNGYVTSGATVPDQAVTDGIVVIQVVEGALDEIEVAGNRRFRDGYFQSRLRRAGRAPVNVYDLEKRLQRFQRDSRLQTVQARLLPGDRVGGSVLHLDVVENRFYGLHLRTANDNSPSIGSYTGYVDPAVWNFVGYGEELRGSFQFSEGLREYNASARAPLPPFDTRLGFHYQYSDSDVVEEPFDRIDIRSETTTYAFTLSQPFYPTRSMELRVGASAEYRTSETFLFDECFAFVPETSSCKMKVSLVRLLADWTWATPRNVVAMRSTLSVGFHALGSTNRSSGLPDSEFVAWLGQAQWAHRLPDRLLGSEVVTRFDAQLANDVLPGIEKFSVGGMRTVRGYRENQFVRDNGLVASLELRIPLWRDRSERAVVQLASFVDYGRSWNERLRDPQDIASVGIGLRVSPWSWFEGEFYWGNRLEKIEKFGDDIQNKGIHFAVTVKAF